MKKVFIILALVGFTFSTVSCRETTQDKIENSADAVGEDIDRKRCRRNRRRYRKCWTRN